MMQYHAGSVPTVSIQRPDGISLPLWPFWVIRPLTKLSVRPAVIDSHVSRSPPFTPLFTLDPILTNEKRTAERGDLSLASLACSSLPGSGNCHANLHQIYGIPRRPSLWLLLATDGKTDGRRCRTSGSGWGKGNKIPLSVPSSPPLPPPSLSLREESVESGVGTRRRALCGSMDGVECVCERERGEDEMDVLGKYLASHFSLENGAWRPSKETC